MGRPKKEGGMSATDYKRDFNEKNYDRLSPYVKRGKKTDTRKLRKLPGTALTSSWKKPWTNWQRRSWENKKHKPPTHTAPGGVSAFALQSVQYFRC